MEAGSVEAAGAERVLQLSRRAASRRRVNEAPSDPRTTRWHTPRRAHAYYFSCRIIHAGPTLRCSLTCLELARLWDRSLEEGN